MSFREAEDAGYVAIGPAGIANVEKLDDFYERYAQGDNSRITIVHYTDEGDPIYLDLDYDGETITFVRDDSWDAFGGQDKGVKETRCSSLSVRTGEYGVTYGTQYVLGDCSSDIGYSDPEAGEYQLLFLEQVSGSQAEDIVRARHNKSITIVSTTRTGNRYEVQWEYKANCEAGTDYIDVHTGEYAGGEQSIC